MHLCGLAALRVQGLAHRGFFGHFGVGHLVVEVKVSASCAVPVLHRTQELFSGCCIHPYNSAYKDNSEAEAHSHSIYMYSIAKNATHSDVLGQQQERELAPLQVVQCSSSWKEVLQGGVGKARE